MHNVHSAPQVARLPTCSRLAPSGTSAPAAIRDVSARGLGSPEYDPARSFSSEDALPFKRAEKQPLGLQFQSSRSASSMRNVVKTTGLHRAPLSGGVKTATLRYDLPQPPVAVRNLVELARFGHLCTVMSGMHHRRAGYPFGTLIDFAADGAGYPVFSLSPLAIHSRNLLENPKCSLVVQMPGWTGLANARVTIFGDSYQLPSSMQAEARDMFSAKHADDGVERWLSGNTVYFRMSRITDIYFVGGFGTVQWISPEDYLASRPDEIVLGKPTATLQHLNEMFSADLMGLMSLETGERVTEVLFISIDASGADIRVRTSQEFSVQRIGFKERVSTLREAEKALAYAVATMRSVSDLSDGTSPAFP